MCVRKVQAGAQHMTHADVSMIHADVPFTVGTDVVLHGLPVQSHLNGKQGVLEYWDPRSGKWNVRLSQAASAGSPKMRGGGNSSLESSTSSLSSSDKGCGVVRWCCGKEETEELISSRA